MLDGFNGGSVCLFFPGKESDTSTGTDAMSWPKGEVSCPTFKVVL